jgi:hypothetical protein
MSGIVLYMLLVLLTYIANANDTVCHDIANKAPRQFRSFQTSPLFIYPNPSASKELDDTSLIFRFECVLRIFRNPHNVLPKVGEENLVRLGHMDRAR